MYLKTAAYLYISFVSLSLRSPKKEECEEILIVALFFLCLLNPNTKHWGLSSLDKYCHQICTYIRVKFHLDLKDQSQFLIYLLLCELMQIYLPFHWLNCNETPCQVQERIMSICPVTHWLYHECTKDSLAVGIVCI